METEVGVIIVDYVKNQIGFSHSFVADSDGIKGGLVLLWKKDILVQILGHSPNFIDALLQIADVGRWRFTGFFGLPERSRRIEGLPGIFYLNCMQVLVCLGSLWVTLMI